MWWLLSLLAFGEETEKEEEEKEDTSFDDEVEDKKEIKGFFTLYQDSENGEVLLSVKKSQLNKDILYFGYVENGALAARNFKGMFRGSKIMHLEKYHNRIDFVVQNTRYYFDPKSALARSAHSNVSNSNLVSAEIKATKELEDGDALYLIEFDSILLSEDLTRIRSSSDGDYFSVGSISDSRSKIVSLRNYEKNTDVVIISGRDKETLGDWWKGTSIELISEHGAWMRQKNCEWELSENVKNEWMDAVRPVIESFVDRTPGTFLEEKK